MLLFIDVLKLGHNFTPVIIVIIVIVALFRWWSHLHMRLCVFLVCLFVCLWDKKLVSRLSPEIRVRPKPKLPGKNQEPTRNKVPGSGSRFLKF